jgi:hypothetical protein
MARDKDTPNEFMISNFLKIRSCMSNTDMLLEFNSCFLEGVVTHSEIGMCLALTAIHEN